MDYKTVNDYELIYMVRENGEDTKDIIFNKYLPIIKKLSSKYFDYAKKYGVEFDDLVQEGFIGLDSAIKDFKDDSNCLFYSFATLCIERQFQSYCKRLSCGKHSILNAAIENNNLDLDNYPSSYSFDTVLDDNYYENLFTKFKYELTLKNSVVFELKYNGFNYKEISTLLDLPINTVDSRLCKIRKLIRQFQNE